MIRHEKNWDVQFQRAALEPSLWMDTLRDLAGATGSSHGQLIGIGDRRTIPFNWVPDFPESALSKFTEISGGSPAVNFRVAADLRSVRGSICHEQNYDVARSTLRDDAYLDYCSDWDIPFGCHVQLATGGGGMIGLALLRSERDGRSTDAQRAEFARAVNAARAAVQLQMAFEQQGATIARGALEAVSLECFLLDSRGHVIEMTRLAEHRIAMGTLLRIADGKLSSMMPDLARKIDLALRSVSTNNLRATVRLATDMGPRLELFRMEQHDWSIRMQPRFVAVIREPAQRLDAGISAFAKNHGLTSAEQEVTILLCRGAQREEIAELRGVTLATLRSQIKSIFAKCGCHRESELLSLVLCEAL